MCTAPKAAAAVAVGLAELLALAGQRGLGGGCSGSSSSAASAVRPLGRGVGSDQACSSSTAMLTGGRVLVGRLLHHNLQQEQQQRRPWAPAPWGPGWTTAAPALAGARALSSSSAAVAAAADGGDAGTTPAPEQQQQQQQQQQEQQPQQEQQQQQSKRRRRRERQQQQQQQQEPTDRDAIFDADRFVPYDPPPPLKPRAAPSAAAATAAAAAPQPAAAGAAAAAAAAVARPIAAALPTFAELLASERRFLRDGRKLAPPLPAQLGAMLQRFQWAPDVKDQALALHANEQLHVQASASFRKFMQRAATRELVEAMAAHVK